jgi:Smg protein
MRIFTDSEQARLPSECRGYLLSLERTGILSPQQREIVIERLLALDTPAGHRPAGQNFAGHHPAGYYPAGYYPAGYYPAGYYEELDVSQLKWVVLMVLSSQPGEELACSRMEDLVFDLAERPH